MDLPGILNRLAEIDHDVTRLEKEHALAQARADHDELLRLETEIARLKKVTADLREEFKRLHP